MIGELSEDALYPTKHHCYWGRVSTMAPTTSRGLQHEKPIGKDDPYGLAEGREGPLSQSEQSKKNQ